jgi:hypothetical protein
MTTPSPAHTAAWGVEIAGDTARLVRVVLEDGGCRLDATHELRREGDAWRPVAGGAAQLPTIAKDEPLGVCIAPEAVVCRGMTLPTADAEAREKMVRAQIDVMLTGQAERFTTAWDSVPINGEAGNWVLMCAARKDAVEAAVRAAKALGATPSAALPAPVAAAMAHRGLGAAAAGPALLVAAQVDRTVLSVMSDGTLVGYAMVDTGEANAELHEAYVALIDPLPREARPQRAELIGLNGEERRAKLEELLRLPVAPAAKSPSGADAVWLPAVGAALRAAAPPKPGISFVSPPRASAASPKAVPRTLIRLGAWCLAGVALLYGYDLFRAGWLERRVAEIRDAGAAQGGGLTRQLEVASYLDQDGTPLLTVLDAISQVAPPSMLLTEWHYDRRGTIRLSGTIPNAAEVENLMKKLGEMRVLRKLELISAKIDDNRGVQFEISAELGDQLTAPAPAPATQAKAPAKAGGA